MKNIQYFETLDHIKFSYPHLYKFLRKQTHILIQLHKVALSTYIERKCSIKNNPVFFVSTRYLAEKVGKSHSTVAKALNLFASLNLLQKHSAKDVQLNTSLYNFALEIKGENNHFRFINFLSLPSYDKKVLLRAEKDAKKLNENKITKVDSITRESITKVFGMKKAISIYDIKEEDINKMSPNDLESLSKIRLPKYPSEKEGLNTNEEGLEKDSITL